MTILEELNTTKEQIVVQQTILTMMQHRPIRETLDFLERSIRIDIGKAERIRTKLDATAKP